MINIDEEGYEQLANREHEKQLAGEKAVVYIKDGMKVGLGSGSTVKYFTEALARRVKEEKLSIVAVSTSSKTTALARTCGIPLLPLNDVSSLDVTVDGADEVDTQFNGIKGGGGALLFEKVVANASKQNTWVVDSKKAVMQLGAFPLPVEVIPFAAMQVFRYFKNKGMHPVFRQANGQKIHTDSGNHIIDLHLKTIEDPHWLARTISNIPGVVEHGLFLDMVDRVIIGNDSDIDIRVRG